MQPTFDLDTRGFSAAARNLFEIQRKSEPVFLRQQGRLFTEDVAKMTPPFTFHGAKSVTNQSWGAQRRIGDAAKTGDIKKLFKPIQTFHILSQPQPGKERLKKSLERYIRQSNVSAITKILGNFGIKSEVIAAATYELYLARLIKGRIRKGTRSLIVLQRASIARVIKRAKQHTGTAKAGWARAAAGLGLHLPNWITEHSTPGVWVDHTASYDAYLLIGNLTQYAPDFTHLRICQIALATREQNMKLLLARIVEANLQKAK